MVRIGRERVEIVDITKKELEGWLDSLTNAQKNRLVEALLDLIRQIPQAQSSQACTRKVPGSGSEGSV
jgi:hypothetical protein